MCICSNCSRRGLPRKFSLILIFFCFVAISKPRGCLEACFEACRQAHPERLLVLLQVRIVETCRSCFAAISRSQDPGWLDFILVCHVCLGEAVLTLHRATCTFIFSISGFLGEAALDLHCTTCTFDLFVSALRQKKKQRRVLKSAGKLSTQDLSWLSWPSKGPVSSSSFLKTICRKHS